MTRTLTAFFCFLTILSCVFSDNSITPVVLWHGMGENCCLLTSLGGFQIKLKYSLPGVYIVSLRIGNSIEEDVENSYFMHPDQQIKLACEMVGSDPKLANGFNAIGFSQGSQFLRALQQRCDKAKIKNLISLAGQHQGVYGLPRCSYHLTCDYTRKLLNFAVYYGWVQNFLVQATYWHDPLNEDVYKNYSTFMAEINNERTINTNYIDKIKKLDNFVLVKFTNDGMIQPVESQWFGFYKPGQSVEVESLQESALFKQDRLGLQKLANEGRLHFLSVEGDHLRYSWTWFEQHILEPFLK